MDTRIWNQIGLELVQIHIESSLESKRGRDGRDDLGYDPVEIDVGGPRDIKVTTADVIDSLEERC